MPRVSVVIRCFNEAQHIGRLLRGISQQTVKDIEIILVDSGSTDDTLSIASCYPIKLLTIKPDDFSFGRALNLGCDAAVGEYIVIASAHVYPIYQDWLESLIEPFSNPTVALAYGKQRGNSSSQFSEQQIFATWFPDTSRVLMQNHPFCNNANSAIRRELWEKNPYDESITGLEDLDWAKQTIEQGYCLAYVPQAEIVHVHDETLTRVYNRYRREAIALKKIYPQEHFSLWHFALLYFSNIASDYGHALRERVLIKHWKDILTFRLMQFWGTYRGYRQSRPVSKQLRQTFYYPRRDKTSPLQTSNQNRSVIDYAINPQPIERLH